MPRENYSLHAILRIFEREATVFLMFLDVLSYAVLFFLFNFAY